MSLSVIVLDKCVPFLPLQKYEGGCLK